ncbi:MAG: HNH endonuclease [Rhizobacter sp.]|nr:HNH endonuclease [Rhizobacter sp.]
MDIHHIVPWEICGKHEYKNLIALCPNHHRRAHKGEIDRKSLQLYKSKLVIGFQTSGEALFSAPAVEVKRRIYEVDLASSDCIFDFEFPDFVDPMARIVSKNIEAWGLELLAVFRHSQDAEHRRHPIKPDHPVCWLAGSYQVIRRDASVISVRYDVEQMTFRAAHRSHDTRVQNFFVSAFAPISLQELLVYPEAIEPLAQAAREKLLRSGLDVTHVELGAASEVDRFTRFVVDQYGFTFMFDEYEVAAYAQGRQQVHFAFEELVGIFKQEQLDLLTQADS